MVKVCYRICIVLFVLYSLMLTFSYSYLNTFGLDKESRNGKDIIQTFYRIAWPGNGSILFGFISRYKQDFLEPFERYDIGGGFFLRPWRPSIRSIWNKIGFWHIDKYGENVIRQFWIGIPSWLPVIIFGIIAVVLRIKTRKQGLRLLEARPSEVRG